MRREGSRGNGVLVESAESHSPWKSRQRTAGFPHSHSSDHEYEGERKEAPESGCVQDHVCWNQKLISGSFLDWKMLLN